MAKPLKPLVTRALALQYLEVNAQGREQFLEEQWRLMVEYNFDVTTCMEHYLYWETAYEMLEGVETDEA